MKSLGQRLNILIEARGLTNAGLARLCKVSRQSVIHWRKPRFKRLDASIALIICDQFNINLRWLVRGEGEMDGRAELNLSAEKLASAVEMLEKHLEDSGMRLSSQKKGRAIAIIYQLLSGVVSETAEPVVIKNVLRLVA